MAGFFVAGSGTDIGKTWICAGLLAYWRAKGLNPAALKPVVSGFDPAAAEHSDPVVLLRALGRDVTPQNLAQIAPYRLLAPLAPDQAARREGVELSVGEIAAACAPALAAAQGPLLIEGAGGVMSPINDGQTMLDLALAFERPIVFVAGSYLGAISHALTALSVLTARGAEIALVAVNETPGGVVSLEETALSLQRHHPDAPVVPIARDSVRPGLWFRLSEALGV